MPSLTTETFSQLVCIKCCVNKRRICPFAPLSKLFCLRLLPPIIIYSMLRKILTSISAIVLFASTGLNPVYYVNAQSQRLLHVANYNCHQAFTGTKVLRLQKIKEVNKQMSWFHYKIASSLILLYNIPNPFPFQTKHPILINTVYNWRRGY